MSAVEDISSNDEDNAPQDGGSQNPKIISEGNVLSLDSNKNSENIVAISENTPKPAINIALEGTNKDSGDAAVEILNENLIENDKKSSKLTETSKEILITDSGKGGGDYPVDDVKATKTSELLNEKDASVDSFLEEYDDDITLKKDDDIDQVDEMEDDDMELRWDDDDSSQAAGADYEKSDPKNEKILSEEELLEEPCDENSKDTENKFDSGVLKDNSEDNNFSSNKLEKEVISTNDPGTSPKSDIAIEIDKSTDASEIISKPNTLIDESEEVIISEDELLGEPEITETVISPEIEMLTESNMDKDNDNVLEDKLLEEPEISNDAVDKDQEKKVLIEKSMDSDKNNDEPEGKEDAEIEFQKVVSTVTETKNLDNNTKTHKLVAESKDNTKKSTFEITSFTDIILNTATDDVLEKNLLEEDEPNIENSKIEVSSAIKEPEISMTKDSYDSEDVLLEDKLLEETGTADAIPETDINMEIDDDNEGELLKDDEPDNCMSMDINNSVQSIEDPADNEKMNIDQPKVIHSEMENKEVELPVDPQLTIENVKTDQAIDNNRKEIVQSVDNQVKLTNIINETENTEKLIDNKNKDQPIDSSKTNLQIETQIENTTPETEVKNKSEPKKPIEINKDLKEDSDLHKNNDNDLSICMENSVLAIKTDHLLNRPDVMLEIPTQELIDMDDTDLSMALDETEDIDNTNDDDEIPETTIDKIVSVNDTVYEKPDKEDAVTESGVSEVQNVVKNIAVKVAETVVKETIEESLEKMFADDEPKAKDDEATTRQNQEPEKPSTSCTRMTPDTSDEVPEISDSLGLLAESSGRMMEDDEEPDDDDEGDDDDDFDQDESSNQISAEQSEDSNPPVLENEPVVEQDKELETPDPNDEQFQFKICSVDSTAQVNEEKMDTEEFGTLELQAETIPEEEISTAVDAMLKDGTNNEQAEETQETTDQMEMDTVKLSDTSDNEVDVEPTGVEQQTAAEQSKEVEEHQEISKLSPCESPIKSSNLSPKNSPVNVLATQSPSKQSPSKIKKLEITTQEASSVVNIVDLEESSSSEDDIQELQKETETDTSVEKPPTPDPDNVTNVNIPTGIEIMCTSGGNTSEIVTKEGEVVISRVPKPPPHKPARLNTSEVSIKTASNADPLFIPETKINEQPQSSQSKPKLSLEIFSLDSDEEDSGTKEKPPSPLPHKLTALELEKARETSKCVNYCCTSDSTVPYKVADASVIAYYDAGRKRKSMVCQPCADVVAKRTKNLIQGVKNLTPLLDLEMSKLSQDLVEISDSESEDEEMSPEEPKETIGEEGAKFVEDNLTKFLNDTWKKYDMDTRLKETQIMLDDEIEKLEQDSKEIDAMLNECQVATDKLRCELYATFECRRQELPALIIYDMPDTKFIGLEADPTPPSPTVEVTESRQAKRRMSLSSETPAKRPAIPLGYAPLDADILKDPKAAIPLPDVKIADDDKEEISVVKLSAESAPEDLPPPGEISRPPLRVSMSVYAMKNAFGPWLKGKVLEIQPKNPGAGSVFSLCRIKFDHKTKTNGKVLPARCVAYAEPADVRMTIGTRLIALFKDSNKRESYYSGVVAEIPNPVNNYRYLVFFDDGYAQYVHHQFTRLVCESSPLVWEEVHPFSRDFVREYLLAYPERPMVRLHEGQHLKTEWNGKWWSSRVTRVDASLAQVMFVGDGRREWIYRGSTRLAPLYLELRAAERHRPRPMPRSKAQPRFNMPYVEYTRSDEQESAKQPEPQTQQEQQQSEEIRRQRAVAKKSTSVPQTPPPPQQPVPNTVDSVTSRVVYYTPKNAVKPYKMVPHKCGPKCKRSDVLSLKELRTYNPLAKPLLSGWERQIVRFKGHKEVMYRAPCGRRLRNLRELHLYLRTTDSDLPVDLFDFHYSTHCLAEFVLNKCLVGKKDLSHGKENVPVPCVNYYDDSLPEFCSYNTERTPTAGVPLNLEPEFLCGCDCTDDCQDKSKCACWKMTLEGARTIGLSGPNVGYVYKRLPEPLPSGIYECNSRCKCKHTCLNRVAQHPLQLKLQVFKTLNRGWGIRALNDVPKGSFLCVYAGNLLTDATANLDGLNEGDEYLAELDYIEVVEQMKEGYEEDIPEADKKLDKKDKGKDDDEAEDEEPSSSEDEDTASKTDKEDDDFRPGYIGLGVMEFNKRLRKRERSKKDKEKSATDEKEKEKDKDTKENKESNAEEDCITISDDEEVREPSRFMVQAGMGASEFISKYKSVRTLFGKDEACYIMDAKVQGNIGRYLNHSCCPNVFVQNVFVDTHDPRFPWVAFFALSHIKAGTELTWNYNYDVGSVPGKVLYCFCGAPNCRGRLL